MALLQYLHHMPLASSNRTETPMHRAAAAAFSFPAPFSYPSVIFATAKDLKPSIFSAFPRSGCRGSFPFISKLPNWPWKAIGSCILADLKPVVVVRAEVQEFAGDLAADAFKEFKHMLLPITDPSPYLSEGTRQAAVTATAMAKKYGSDIMVVVIDEKPKDLRTEHDTQLSSIRWHLSEGGFQEFGLMERLGEGKKPTAIIGEVADEMNMDLVVLSMEAIHSKHVDANLLAEFIPCPVLLLPL